MIYKSLDSIDPSDIESLLENGVVESRTIEYKSQLPGNSDDEKKEFLADASAFANTDGGDIIFGIAANDHSGVPEQVLGVAATDFDASVRRLDSILNDSLDPRLLNHQFKKVEMDSGLTVLILRVPRSWIAPHMVKFKGASRFFSRGAASKYPMDASQIRAAFERSSGLIESLREWSVVRLRAIQRNETPVPLPTRDCLVVHLIPIDALSNPLRISTAALKDRQIGFRCMKVAGWNWKVNADGFVTYAQPVASIGELSSYCQVFRSGCVESVCAPFSIQWQSDWAIHAELFEQQVHGVVRSYREELGKLGVVSPLLLCVSLLQAKGMRLASTSKSWGGTEFLDRNALHLPEVLIEDTATPLSRQLRPAFDGLWNAFGCWQSAHFDAQGNWLLKHD